MNLSVIIPTRNAGASIEKLINSLKTQTLKPSEIIVIDSSSEDNTIGLARKVGARVLVIERSAFDHGGTRNLGAKHANGDILVFMTQDALPLNEDTLRNLIYPLKDADIGASYARQIPKADATPVEVYTRLFNYPAEWIVKEKNSINLLGIKTFFFSNVCSAVKRDAFEKVGGFPERIIMNEDMFLAAKLINNGYKIVYEPSAMVYHSHNYSPFGQFRRYFDIGVFMSRNKWIMDVATPEGEGFRYAKGLIKYLVNNRLYVWIPYAMVDMIFRLAGYRFGLRERHLPGWLKRRLSNNKHFWDTNGISQ